MDGCFGLGVTSVIAVKINVLVAANNIQILITTRVFVGQT